MKKETKTIKQIDTSIALLKEAVEKVDKRLALSWATADTELISSRIK